MKKIFFQSSLPRSGSTLLQNIIGQNPDFYVTPTSGVCELIISIKNAYTYIHEFKAQDQTTIENGLKGFYTGALHGFFNAITDKPYVIDKSRGWGSYLNLLNFFTNHDNKIICMVRDPRAIICSMEILRRKNPHISSGVEYENNSPVLTMEHRADIWVRPNSLPVGISFERLRQIILENNATKILFIKYEDLTSDPKRELKRIYDYLEVPEFEHNFDHVEQVTHENDVIHGMYGNHKIQNKLALKSYDFTDVLGLNTCNLITEYYSWFYDYFNYKK